MTLQDINEIDVVEKPKHIEVYSTSSTVFKGPLPQPEILKQYDVIVPGAAERILKMAEKEQEHQLSTDKLIVEAQINELKMGRIFAFILVIALIIIAIIFALLNHPTIAITTVGIIIGVASLFLLRKWGTDKNEKEEL